MMPPSSKLVYNSINYIEYRLYRLTYHKSYLLELKTNLAMS